MRTLLKELLRCNSGTATLEMIIILPITILLMTGGVEFGNLYSSYETVSKSARDATRYLTRVPSKDDSGKNTGALCGGGWALANATNLAIYGNIAGTGTAQLPTSTVVTVTIADCNNPTDISVKVDAPYTVLLFGSIPHVLGGSTPAIFTGRHMVVTHEETWIGE